MTEKTYKLKLNGKELKVELKNLAEQANGEVLVQYGDTLVLATCVMAQERQGIDFFPLTVGYEERYYAAGKIRGSRYMRREGRPSDAAILTSRLIDRAIRPRFPKGFKKEVQIIITCLSWDAENDPDILGLIAASLALSISDIPWSGPISAVRIGKINGKFIPNPSYEEREIDKLDLTMSAIGPSLLINMIEADAQEVSEEVIMEANKFAKPYLKKIIDFQEQIIKEQGKEKIAVDIQSPDAELEKEIKDFLKNQELEKALFAKDKQERQKGIDNIKEKLLNFITEKYPNSPGGEKKIKQANDLLEQEINGLIHKNIIEKEKRPDGRELDEVRKISCEVGLLPRTHGSGLFTRGITRGLSILTLGAPGDVQLLDGMEIVGKKRFMLHYNFPPYSVGEARMLRGPGRREIGHGNLAEIALLPLIPDVDNFPYTIRIVSEMLSSNGSTSMASVSSASLALMDAGVPIKTPATGIAIGLMSNEKGDYKILTDIQGPEDHYGDMDLKVAGTENGITAIQMDVKVDGINEKILEQALSQAKKARLQILDEMKKAIDGPRPKLSPYAPRILTIQIDPKKIREVIGPGGKIINEIIEKCEVSIDIEDTGEIFITAEKEESAKKAVEWIKNIIREAKVGEIFQGKVKRIMDFGAFVEILPNQEGLVHISKLADHRVEKVEDIVKVGDILPVKVVEIDQQGRINLSAKI
ncbi:polyribonucleotide nucleotidyltransferase [Candidatus Parcubacteria bacterium]|nr:polyribonucleotide nucleotidyltransferase [Candidatus Parcubacteria bacterium]